MLGPLLHRALLGALLLAAAPPAAAAPRGCLTGAEAMAEQAIRHGIRLREGAWRCEDLGYTRDSAALWRKVDTAVGAQFRTQTEMRQTAFAREFEDNAERTRVVWNGRIVLHFRYRPMSAELCGDIESMLQEIDQQGWAAFLKQANRLRNEVRLDYRVCGGR